jgi:hypothetical protein
LVQQVLDVYNTTEDKANENVYWVISLFTLLEAYNAGILSRKFVMQNYRERERDDISDNV